MIAGPFGVNIDIFRLWPIDSIRFGVVQIRIALWPQRFDLFFFKDIYDVFFSAEENKQEKVHENGVAYAAGAKKRH